MKKTILNYVITYRQNINGTYSDTINEIYMTKKNALLRYLKILNGEIFADYGPGSICELSFWETYRNDTEPKNITDKINSFIL